MRADTVRLADLCDLIADQVRPAERPDAPYLGLEHLAPGRLAPIAFGSASDVRSTTSAFLPGDVLYGKLRPYLDKAILADSPGLCTTELLVLRAKEGVDPRFLAAVLHSQAFVHHAVAGTTGVQHPRTSWAHLREFETPALEPDEQRPLVDLIWSVHDSITHSAKSLEASQALKCAAMHTLFTRGLRHETQRETEIGPVPQSWRLEPIGAVFNITQGLSLKGNLATDGTGTPFLRTSNVYWGRVELGSLSRMHLRDEPRPQKMLVAGDLLVCEGGEVGRAAVWDGDLDDCLFQNHLHCLRPVDPSRTNPRFAVAWLEEGFKHRSVYEGASNRTTIANLSRTRLAGLSMPHPPAREQRQIVAILDSIDRKMDLHLRKCAILEELFQALLHKVMMGEVRVGELGLAAIGDREAIH